MNHAADRAGTVNIAANSPVFQLICCHVAHITAGSTRVFDPYLSSDFFGSVAHLVNLLRVSQGFDCCSLAVYHGYSDWHPAIQAVCGTRHSGVVGAHRHLYLVEQPLIIYTVFNQACGSLFHAHVHGRDIMGGADNHVGLDNAAVVIGGVVMD